MTRYLMACVAVLAFWGHAWAIDGTAQEIDVQNGVIGLVDPLAVAKGGTGAASLTANSVVIGQGTNPVTTAGPGTQGQVLVSNGAGVDPAFEALDLADADAVTGILPVGNGGTGVATATDDTALIGDGTAWQGKTVPNCTGASAALTYDGATNTFACNTISAGLVPLLTMSTLGDVTGGATVFMSPGTVDADEARAQQIAPVAASFTNLRCVASVAPGTAESVTVTMGDGPCTAALTDSAGQVCTISGTSRSCTAATTAEAVTAGECVRWKVVASATAAASVVNCAVERAS